MLPLQLINPLPKDSVPEIPDPKQELEMLKSLPLDEVMDKLVNAAAEFAIHLAVAIIVFYVGRFIIRKIYKVIGTIMVHRKVDRSLTTFILSLINIVLYFILLITVIGILGLETSSFLAIFASVGVAIGMALSGTAQNFAGGVMILLMKPYRVGDYISAQGQSGTVREIKLFSTVITTADNQTIYIPNNSIATAIIDNYSPSDTRRVDWTIGISYGDDVDTARAAILAILAADNRVLGDPAPVVWVAALADSSVNLSARAWVKNGDYWNVFFENNEKFYKQLPEKGINFPFPQMDVHVKNN